MASMSVTELLNLENPIFRAWAFYGSLLLLKMLAMSVLTGSTRYRKKVFANPEDVGFTKEQRERRQKQIRFDDPDVERVRRAHLNDIENILVYMSISFLYILTNPSAGLAIMLFRAVAAGRFAHTFVYAVMPLPQPSRAIAWGIPYMITIYMGVSTALFFA